MAGIDKIRIALFIGILLIVFWCYMFISLFQSDVEERRPLRPQTREILITPHREDISGNVRREVQGTRLTTASSSGAHARSSSVASPASAKLDRTAIERILSEKLPLPERQDAAKPQIPPPPIEEVSANMTRYLHTLHKRLGDLAGPSVEPMDIWETFLEVTRDMPMTWDEQNRHRFPMPRKDNSIFVSLGTYRDPYCPMTLKSLYTNAHHPERLFVGLFQQNCFGPVCRTGVLAGGRVETAGADMDCYVEFCKSPIGQSSGACLNGHVRLFNVNESESLGPYMARYLGAKFYRGEQYYLQIDSHSEFVENWDDKLIEMVQNAEAEKPVISTYPPDSTQNWKNTIGFRMCDSEFAAAQIEWQIVRLGSSLAFDHKIPDRPCYAPFVAAGFFFSYADFLYEVPFDPFLPWIFMGEEISMSARLWTSGYDIFSPTINILNHYYVRRHYPKFWESVNR